MNITQMPDEIILGIFSNLSIPQIGSMSKVCSDWNRIAKTDILWKNFILRDFKKDPTLEILKKRTYKQYYKDQVWETLRVNFQILTLSKTQGFLRSFSSWGNLVNGSLEYDCVQGKNYPIRDAFNYFKEVNNPDKNIHSRTVTELSIMPGNSTMKKTTNLSKKEGLETVRSKEDPSFRVLKEKVFPNALSINEATKKLYPNNIRYFYKPN